MKRTAIVLSLLAAVAARADDPARPKFWKDAPDQAKILAATYLGGKGTEWLCSGGFLPDGTVVLAGDVLGPTLELPVPVAVIGDDLPPPAEPKPVPLMDGDRQKLDKEGKPLWERPSWRHDGVTGFVVLCSSDLKKILSARRLPWCSGAITAAAVGTDGAVYIAGKAGDDVGRLGGDVRELKPGGDSGRKDGPCRHTFVARLSADAAKCEWVRHESGFSNAPRLWPRKDGGVRLGAQDLRTFDAKGRELTVVAVPGGVRPTTSVSPADGSLVVGGEHHWPTGREPWRCPTLNVYRDGKQVEQLYDWGGPYVGLDDLRLVSDSAVRWVTHEPDGSILIYAWSDGGNSVMTCQPADVRTGVGLRGLGITAAGAGVLSAAYLIRIDPHDYRVTAWTIWLAFTAKGKPNSVWVDDLDEASDGSVCIAGRSAWGLWQTSNRLSDGAPEGEYVAVLDHDLTAIRFCSVVPGAGAAEVGDGSQKNGSGWGVVSGAVDGKPRVLFVGGAAKESDGPAPTKNALQEAFGGGRSDGYAVLLDLSGAAPAGRAPPEPAAPISIRFEDRAPAKDAKHAPQTPQDGTVFHFTPDYPKWVTADAEFRDPSGKLGPSFFYGKPQEGTFTWKAGGPEASFAVAFPSLCQPKGDPARRVLGELVHDPDAPPAVRFTLESLGPVQTAEVKTVEKGAEKARTVEYCEGKATLEVGGRKLGVSPRVTFRFAGPKGGDADGVRLTAWLTLKAADLGLKAPAADAEIDVRVGMGGSVRTGPPPKK